MNPEKINIAGLFRKFQPVYHDKNLIRNAQRFYKRNLAEPGDMGRDNVRLLATLAIAEAWVGHNPGWIPETQKIAVEMLKLFETH